MELVHKKETATQQFLTYLGSTGVVSALTKTATAPLERVKLIMQAQNVLTLNERYKFRSYLQYFTRVPKEQGVQAFWRGNFANILNIFPQAMCQFWFYDNIQRVFYPQGEKIQSDGSYVLNRFFTAMCCGSLSLIFTYPLDTVRVRLALEFSKKKEHRAFKGVMQTIGETKQRQGLTQLYRGFLLANFTNLHYFISLYTIIDVIKNAETRELVSKDSMNLLHYVGVNQIGALFALAAMYPLDTIRRRLQINGYNRNPVYLNTVDCFKKVQQMEGLGSLYRGIGAACTKHILAAGLQTILIKEMVANNLNLY